MFGGNYIISKKIASTKKSTYICKKIINYENNKLYRIKK